MSQRHVAGFSGHRQKTRRITNNQTNAKYETTMHEKVGGLNSFTKYFPVRHDM